MQLIIIAHKELRKYIHMSNYNVRHKLSLYIEKSWRPCIDEETDNAQLEFVNDASQAYECTHRNYSKAEEMELIAKIVRDLRDIQIGDSRYVLSPSLLTLEKQVIGCSCIDGNQLSETLLFRHNLWQLL